MQSKAGGPDAWNAKELMHLPNCVLHLSGLQAAEADDVPWPTALLQWRQVHLLKPSKPRGLLTSFRPLSVGSCWYRAWSYTRIRHLRDWIAQVMPCEFSVRVTI